MLKKYIGDGVYVARDDAWPDMLVLTTENGVEITNTIMLEPAVWNALADYVERTDSDTTGAVENAL